jgi:hypothetical protein
LGRRPRKEKGFMGNEGKGIRAKKFEFRVGGRAVWGCPHKLVEYEVDKCKVCGREYFICPVCLLNESVSGGLCPGCGEEEES